ncbi:hypothetical protein D779_3308 [Imhoffiella purpurea]|uniref:Uncharacterized protein n=1 Tax=Imhoffiella purpurea TaxID=1249627 RepID=W9V351_9GAMM|nr:hypothetical protein D779_3308 [Imhoffiella purpurea]
MEDRAVFQNQNCGFSQGYLRIRARTRDGRGGKHERRHQHVLGLGHWLRTDPGEF